MSMIWPPHRVKIVSTPSALRALATSRPPETMFASLLLRLSVSPAVLVPVFGTGSLLINGSSSIWTAPVVESGPDLGAASRRGDRAAVSRCPRCGERDTPAAGPASRDRAVVRLLEAHEFVI